MSKSPKKKGVRGAGDGAYQTQQAHYGGRGGGQASQQDPMDPQPLKGGGTGEDPGDDGDPKHRPGAKPLV
jgi:hypothetical protein